MSAIETAVDEYVKHVRPDTAEEFKEWRALTDEVAVERAALGLWSDGRAKHPHQYRVPRAALEKSRKRLAANLPKLRAAETFDAPFGLVEDLIMPIQGIGELMVYDTAIRIGARFDLEPVKVYVHAGTRDGVRALGLDGGQAVIDMHALPEPIRRLSGREAEDLLCRYRPASPGFVHDSYLRCDEASSSIAIISR